MGIFGFTLGRNPCIVGWGDVTSVHSGEGGTVGNSGAEVMAKQKGRPRSAGAKAAETSLTARYTIVNLKGSAAQAEWLEAAHKTTHLPKSTIVRLALTEWAKATPKVSPFPIADDD